MSCLKCDQKAKCRIKLCNKLVAYRETPWYIPINHWALFFIEMIFELLIIGFITLWPSNKAGKGYYDFDTWNSKDYLVIAYQFFLFVILIAGLLWWLYYVFFVAVPIHEEYALLLKKDHNQKIQKCYNLAYRIK